MSSVEFEKTQMIVYAINHGFELLAVCFIAYAVLSLIFNWIMFRIEINHDKTRISK